MYISFRGCQRQTLLIFYGYKTEWIGDEEWKGLGMIWKNDVME